MKRLVSAHYSAPVTFTSSTCKELMQKIEDNKWASSEGDFTFLGKLDRILLRIGIVPDNPLKAFKD